MKRVTKKNASSLIQQLVDRWNPLEVHFGWAIDNNPDRRDWDNICSEVDGDYRHIEKKIRRLSDRLNKLASTKVKKLAGECDNATIDLEMIHKEAWFRVGFAMGQKTQK